VFVCILPEKAVPEMIYTVSGATLNLTHSLTHSTLNLIEFHFLAVLIYEMLHYASL